MPSSYHFDYNPVIVGFVEGEGYVNVPLQLARRKYGQYPSAYGLVSNARNRQDRKALNLSLGLAVTRLLKERENLKGMVAAFYQRWYRDFGKDFDVAIDALRNLNQHAAVKRALHENLGSLAKTLEIDLLEYLSASNLIGRSTLRSIPEALVIEKTLEILEKKRRNPAHRAQRESIESAAALLRARALVRDLSGLVDLAGARVSEKRLRAYGDEIAQLLWRVGHYLPMAGTDDLVCRRGEGVEFEFSTRDASFLDLGKAIGDCTADKTFQQVDRNVENIYWTVFPWMLDYNYQVLKVYCDDELVMKVHLLPLLLATRKADVLVLAVDAMETTPAFREDTKEGKPDLLARKAQVFSAVVEEIRRIARRMGIEHVYAEKFSNTDWVRKELDVFPEMYLHIDDIRKVDELEDVFELARQVCEEAGEEIPTSVFMELQMKNTFLRPGYRGGRGVKSYAVVEGGRELGIPMKRVIGI